MKKLVTYNSLNMCFDANMVAVRFIDADGLAHDYPITSLTNGAINLHGGHGEVFTATIVGETTQGGVLQLNMYDNTGTIIGVSVYTTTTQLVSFDQLSSMIIGCQINPS